MTQNNAGAEATNSDELELDKLREGIDDPMVLKEQLKKEADARRQLTARAKKAEEDLKAEREARIKAEEKPQGDTTINNNSGSEEDRLELRFQGYTKEEVTYIMQNGGPKIMDDPNSLTAIAINTRREQLAAEKAAAGTNNSGGEDQFREANFSLPHTPTLSDLKKSVSEMEKVLPHA